MNLCLLLAANALVGACISVGINHQQFLRYFLSLNLLSAWWFFIEIWKTLDPSQTFQFAYSMPWLTYMGSQWLFALDGISMVMIGLSLVMVSIVILYQIFSSRMSAYLCALFLLILAMLIGLFTAQDAISFFVFWEGTMFPMYLCVGIWGGEDRINAAMKFFIYTFSGSILMLMGILYVGVSAGSFMFEAMWAQPLTLIEQQILFWLLLVGMAVKTPMWPLHTWLPDAHTQAPTEGSVLLAALLLKVGTYGMIRLLLPVVPDACSMYANVILVISLISIIYVGILTSAQKDMKRLIAYASISHMGFVTLGLFSIYLVSDLKYATLGFLGALVVMVAHAFSSGALFLSFGMVYQQLKTRRIEHMTGLYQVMPWVGSMFLVYVFSTVGLPTTAGFVGEWMVILSALSGQSAWAGVLAATTMVISVVYMLGVYQKVFYGQSDQVVSPISMPYKGLLLILTIAIFSIGLYPNFLVDKMRIPAAEIITTSLRSKVTS
ncbi:NADH-quinone oxidoreductase subunit M [Gammaproteobacteria bacterium]|nr:NADH-quinone oxidoreductase subunit M [Gammaproteobacteria bacterium]